MSPSNSLFYLIKSLSKNEKGYFKKYVSGFSASENNYSKLFDAIDEQTDYDEKKIIERFKQEKFIKQLSVTKNLLFDVVLRSLRAYHAANSATIQINTHIENAEILFARSLADEAFNELEKARSLTIEHDSIERRIEIDKLERSFHLELAASDWKEKLESSYSKTDLDIEALSVLHEIHKVYYKMLHFWRHERLIRTDEQAAYIEQLVSLKNLHEEPSQFSFNTHQTILTIWMIFYFLKNENEASYVNMKKVLDLWEANPHIKKAKPVRYIAALNNYFSTCVRTDRFDAIDAFIEQLDTGFLDGNDTSAAILFENLTTYRFMILFNRKRFDTLLEVVKAAEIELPKHEKKINQVRLLLFKYNCLMMYFTINKMSEALDRLNELLLIKDIELRRDLQAAVRILNLIVHYELGNSVLLANAIKSSRRYLESRDKLYETEKVFFRHFSKLSLKADNLQKQKVYAAMKQEIETLFIADPLEKNFSQTLDLLIWINSKQKGVSIAEYYTNTEN
jgi:hypothetical protein